MVLVELDVRRALDFHLGRGGDDLGVEIARQADQRLHDALHIHHHGFDRAGQDGQLLVQEVARSRDALAHQDFVGRAADAGQVDALGAGCLGIFDDLGVLRGRHDHLAQGRLVAVDDHVDHIVLQHAQVGLAQDRGRGAKQDVGDIGGDHAAAPAIGQGGADGVVQDVLRVLVVADMGAVQRFDHFAVDAARHDALSLATAPGASSGARLIGTISPRCWPNWAIYRSARSLAISLGERPSIGIS